MYIYCRLVHNTEEKCTQDRSCSCVEVDWWDCTDTVLAVSYIADGNDLEGRDLGIRVAGLSFD